MMKKKRVRELLPHPLFLLSLTPFAVHLNRFGENLGSDRIGRLGLELGASLFQRFTRAQELQSLAADVARDERLNITAAGSGLLLKVSLVGETLLARDDAPELGGNLPLSRSRGFCGFCGHMFFVFVFFVYAILLACQYIIVK